MRGLLTLTTERYTVKVSWKHKLNSCKSRRKRFHENYLLNTSQWNYQQIAIGLSQNFGNVTLSLPKPVIEMQLEFLVRASSTQTFKHFVCLKVPLLTQAEK